MEIGPQVRRERLRLGLSQTQVAERLSELGWFTGGKPNHQAVGAVERDEQQVTLRQWLLLSRALEVAPLALLLPDASVEVDSLGPLDRWELVAWILGDEPPIPDDTLHTGDLGWYRQVRPAIERLSTDVAQLASWRGRLDADSDNLREAARRAVTEYEAEVRNGADLLLLHLDAFQQLSDLELRSLIPDHLLDVVDEARRARRRRDRLRALDDDQPGEWPRRVEVDGGTWVKFAPGRAIEWED